MNKNRKFVDFYFLFKMAELLFKTSAFLVE